MRSRVLLITALLVGGFLLITSKTDWGQRRIDPADHPACPLLVRLPRRRTARG